MSDRDSTQHDAAACARAWQTLRMAHDRVAQRLGAALARECGLAINEFDVLLYLHTHPDADVRVTTLLDAVALSQPALSRLIARLEARGLLARCPTDDDRRAVVVRLSAAGSVLIGQAIAVQARAVHETLTSRFSDEEQEVLLRVLSQVGR